MWHPAAQPAGAGAPQQSPLALLSPTSQHSTSRPSTSPSPMLARRPSHRSSMGLSAVVGAPPPSGGTASVSRSNALLSPRHMPLVPVAGNPAVPVSGRIRHSQRHWCATDAANTARSVSPMANGRGDCPSSPRVHRADTACTAAVELAPSPKYVATVESLRGGSVSVMEGRLPPSPLRNRGLAEHGSNQAILSNIPSIQRIPAVGSKAIPTPVFAPFPRAKSPMEADRSLSPNRTVQAATTADTPAMPCTPRPAVEVVAPSESRNAGSPAHLETFCTVDGAAPGRLTACSGSASPPAETSNGADLGRHGLSSWNARGGVSSPRKDGRRQREACHRDLYEDAFARQQRLRNIKDTQEQALEREQQMRLEQHQQGMRQRRRMYHTKDARTHLEREEEFLRKKREKEMMILSSLHQRELDELKECTFKPSLATKKSDKGGCRHQSPSQRQSRVPESFDSSPSETDLLHLVRQQHAITERLLALVGEDARLKDKLRTMHADLHDRIQSEETRRVVAMLQDAGSDAGGQQELIQRVRSMGAAGVSPDTAQRVIVDELVAHSQEEVQRRVFEAFAPMRFEAEKEVFDQRLALVQELETLETQAAAICSGTFAWKNGSQSGFQFGLAKQARLDLPLPPSFAAVCSPSPPLPSASRFMDSATSSDSMRTLHKTTGESAGTGVVQIQTSTPPGADARLRAPTIDDNVTFSGNRHIDGNRAESSTDEIWASLEDSQGLAKQPPPSNRGVLEEKLSPRPSPATSTMFKTPRTLSFSRSLVAGEFALQMQSAPPITPPLSTTSGMPHGGAVDVRQMHDDRLESDVQPELPPVRCSSRDQPEFDAVSRPSVACSCGATSQSWTTPMRTSGRETFAAGVSVTVSPDVTSGNSDCSQAPKTGNQN